MKTAESQSVEALKVQKENIIEMPLGLLGFEEVKKFVLLSTPGEEPFQWFQVFNDPCLAFLVISPFEVLKEYQPDLSPADVEFLGLKDPADALLINIVTLRANGTATVNLKGPIVLNRHDLRGKQCILTNAADYALQHPLPAGA